MPIASIAATASSFSPIRDTAYMDYPAVNGTYESTQDDFAFDPVEDALKAFKRGEFVVVMDDDNRENEGDLICAASLVTTEKMAWFIKHTRLVDTPYFLTSNEI
jgi:3,4-dihydroxy-2-butanone 4-phosphate synthase